MMSQLLAIFNSSSFLENIVIGIIGGIILKILSLIYIRLSDYIYSHKNFSIAGIWIAEFESINNKKNIEIVCIREKKELIDLYFEHYDNKNNRIQKIKGKGIFKGGVLSLFYFSKSKNDMATGTMILKTSNSVIEGTTLNGMFFEEIEINGRQNTKKLKYTMKRFKIPFAIKLRHLFRGVYFNSYNELVEYLEKIKANN